MMRPVASTAQSMIGFLRAQTGTDTWDQTHYQTHLWLIEIWPYRQASRSPRWETEISRRLVPIQYVHSIGSGRTTNAQPA